MSGEQKIHIIGIGDDGLDGLNRSVCQLIEKADLLVGHGRTLEGIPPTAGERLPVANDPDEAFRRIAAVPEKRIAILASGDPMFYGLARYLCEKMGKERFEVVPHVSSMQLAFARVKESWEEAYLTDLANHSLSTVIDKIRTSEKAGLFTSEEASPNQIAEALLGRGIDYFFAYVCENLGSPDERVTQGELSEIVRSEFAPLNVMILIRKPDAPDRPAESAGVRLFGNPDDAFLQSKPKQGLMTPAEIRAQALAELDLGRTSIVWDIGAGSGSVSIEAAQLATEGAVYAIEMDAEDHQLIEENAQRFGVQNVKAILGRAPDAWSGLPDPHAVFIEGSGREVGRIVSLAYEKLRPGGRLVASVASIESVADLHRVMLERTAEVKVWMLNIARGTYQLERLRFDAINPSFLLALVKPE